MNKKRLSVVMAGAMLASSVAPVLAADAEVSKVEIEKGVLIAELAQKIWEAPRFNTEVKDGSVDSTLAGRSVYGIQIGDTVKVLDASVIGTNTPATLQDEIKAFFNTKKVIPGTVVKLVDLGHTTVKKVINEKEVDCIVSNSETTTYSHSELVNGKNIDGSVAKAIDTMSNDATAGTKFNAIVDVNKSEYVDSEKGFVVQFTSDVDLNNDGEADKLILKEGMDRVDFSRYYADVDKKTISAIGATTPGTVSTDFFGFPKANPVYSDIPTKTLTEYTVTTSGSVFKLSELYDAPFLTEKGQTLLDLAKAAYNELSKVDSLTVGTGSQVTDGTATTALEKLKRHTVRFSKDSDPSIQTGANAVEDLTDALAGFEKVNGLYRARVEIVNPSRVKAKLIKAGNADWTPAADDYDVYYVTAESEKELVRVLKGIDQLAPAVDRLVGADRYATAVKIAKEVGLVAGTAGTSDIVLVNGRSLVDGLAAAPLASSFGPNEAPILLTEAGKLPTATKRYLKELIDTKINKNITVHIVGGEAVVSDSVKKELRDLGLRVERLGGENREATSMAVADAITDGKIENAFVVGANGEADAMSISGKAAELSTPIIVSSYKGLSEETLDVLEGSNVTVLGGEKALSAAEYENIDSVAGSIKRIAGTNRKDTNAKIISTFYNNSFAGPAKSVLVAKDDELVDALTASNLSAQKGAPIVLATNELSKAQLDAVVTNAKDSTQVYQIGGGVAPAVVKAVAKALNLI